jgi:hypothetical protein
MTFSRSPLSTSSIMVFFTFVHLSWHELPGVLLHELTYKSDAKCIPSHQSLIASRKMKFAVLIVVVLVVVVAVFAGGPAYGSSSSEIVHESFDDVSSKTEEEPWIYKPPADVFVGEF